VSERVDEILRINGRFNGNPDRLDEALNSGDGTCKPRDALEQYRKAFSKGSL
jgi:hypothetical protein